MACFQVGAGFTLTMDPNDPEYQRLKAAAQRPDPANPGAALDQLRDRTEISAVPMINRAGVSMLNFHGEAVTEPLPGGGTVLYLPEAQVSSGSSGQPAAYVLLGPWGPMQAAKLDATSTKVSIKAKLNPAAPRLSVQRWPSLWLAAETSRRS